MPGTQLPQTYRIIQALLRAGYARSEFMVRTPCVRGEYQDTKVLVRARFDRQESLVRSVLATGELNVTLFLYVKRDGSVFHDFMYEPCRSGSSKYSICNIDVNSILKES